MISIATNRHFRLWFLLGAWPLVVLVRASSGAPPKPKNEAGRKIVASLVDAHNRARLREDLPKLALNDKLSAAAQAHADDMAERKRPSHEGSDGSTPFQRIEKAGYKYALAAENVASGQRSVGEVMKDWMASEGHRHNILNKYADLGIGYAIDDDGQTYWCVTFGRPLRERRPPVDELKGVDPATIVAQVVDAHNKERAKDDLPPLELNKKLSAAAQKHAEDMAEHKKMSHEGSNGSTPFRRMEKEGYKYRRAGENVAYGQRSVGELMKVWMESETHKDNVFGKFSEIGVGHATDTDGVSYWCVTFGTPLS